MYWLLAHITRDLPQAEKKITVVTSWATDTITTIFTQNDNFDNFAQFVTTFIFFSDWDMSRVKRPTAKTQHRCRPCLKKKQRRCSKLWRMSNDVTNSKPSHNGLTPILMKYSDIFIQFSPNFYFTGPSEGLKIRGCQ